MQKNTRTPEQHCLVTGDKKQHTRVITMAIDILQINGGYGWSIYKKLTDITMHTELALA